MSQGTSSSPNEEVRVAQRYFASFAQDYHGAFAGQGKNPLHRLINVLFRRKTFERRMAIVRGFLEAHGIAGKQVLDLGCGSGQVSLLAARMGARVTGIDVVEDMVATARRQAVDAGFGDSTEFRVGDVHSADLKPSDVTLIVSVLEYYSEIDSVLTRACGITRELLVLVDTRGPWWRRALRQLLARLKGFSIYYRTPEEFSAVVTRAGFTERARVKGHSFWAMAYRRNA
jgi:2-polyprenyl-3-methyl-5-hydroxy-6-metoxy-1,4-benzoquinol methylase